MSFDTPAENKAFAEKFGFQYPLLCDTDRKMGEAYGATDPGGKGGAKRIGVIVGADGKIKEWIPKADTKGFPHDALKKI